MPDQPNGNYEWREEMRRNWEDHGRIYKSIEELRASVERLGASVETLRESNIRLHLDVQNLVEGIRNLIDRIPPQNLR